MIQAIVTASPTLEQCCGDRFGGLIREYGQVAWGGTVSGLTGGELVR